MKTKTYDSYFLMTVADVPDYIKAKVDFFTEDEQLSVDEIGDGNVNYIFQVRGKHKSVIIKQAGDATRLDPTWQLTTERGRIEADYLAMQEKLNPGSTPELYLYDLVMCAIIMEELSGDYAILRFALLERRRFPRFADMFSTYLVNALVLTSDIVLDHQEKKLLAKQFINPQMCDIFEKLNNTEPFIDVYKRNRVMSENKDFVQAEFYEDVAFRLEGAKLKFEFMNNAQALIHADLHTGAVFVREDSIKIFDTEFAFFGPMGVDPGNFTAHIFFAWANADAEAVQDVSILSFKQWLLETIENFFALFIKKFKNLFRERVTDLMAKTPGFSEWYLGTVLSEAAGACGLELARRTIGLSYLPDLINIQDEARRARTERIMLRLAKDLILNRASIKSGTDYTAALKRATATEEAESDEATYLDYVFL
ncbi:MAG: S-methyl-5-thioribose kinase [Treponema sp.]|jgi:5-methylthioribose kinase|nr:S-methyl-5-thioribose kinase [Treponema sp.]